MRSGVAPLKSTLYVIVTSYVVPLTVTSVMLVGLEGVPPSNVTAAEVGFSDARSSAMIKSRIFKKYMASL
jgi:hypothetical protein